MKPFGRALPALLAALALAAALAVSPQRLFGAPGEGGMVAAAVEANREILLRAAAAFAAAKAIDATLSVVASAEISGSVPFVGGVGGSVSPGSALEPVSDLVGSFATVMLVVASASAGTEVMMRAGPWAFAALLPAGLGLLLGSAVLGLLPGGGPPRLRAAFRRLGRGLVVAVLVLQVFVPLAVLGAARISAALIEPQWQEATARLDVWEERAAAEAPPAAAEESLLDRLGRLRDTIGRVDVGALLSGFDDLFLDLVALIAAFFMRALVLPVVLLWAMGKGTRVLLRAFGAPPDEATAPDPAPALAEPRPDALRGP